jgi:hypothetical protein
MWNYLKPWQQHFSSAMLGETPNPPLDGSLLNWVLWGVLIIISTLATTIGFLYKASENRNKTAIDDMKTQYGLLIASMDAQIKSLQTHITKCDTERLELYVKSGAQDARIEQLQLEINQLRK